MRLGTLPAGVVIAALAGCGPSLPPTAKVGGTVTLDAKPLSQGTIRFEPADKPGAAAITAPVVDGKYSAPVVPHGSYRVAFSSSATAEAPAGPVDSTFNAPTAAAKRDPIPEKYRKASLPADITGDNPNLDFDLRSK